LPKQGHSREFKSSQAFHHLLKKEKRRWLSDNWVLISSRLQSTMIMVLRARPSCEAALSRGVWGHAPPKENFEIYIGHNGI